MADPGCRVTLAWDTAPAHGLCSPLTVLCGARRCPLQPGGRRVRWQRVVKRIISTMVVARCFSSYLQHVSDRRVAAGLPPSLPLPCLEGTLFQLVCRETPVTRVKVALGAGEGRGGECTPLSLRGQTEAPVSCVSLTREYGSGSQEWTSETLRLPPELHGGRAPGSTREQLHLLGGTACGPLPSPHLSQGVDSHLPEMPHRCACNKGPEHRAGPRVGSPRAGVNECRALCFVTHGVSATSSGRLAFRQQLP